MANNMFKFIAFIFIFFASLIGYQIALSVESNYKTLNYIQAEGKVISQEISHQSLGYQLLVKYIFYPSPGITYVATSYKNFQNSHYIKDKEELMLLAEVYKPGKFIKVYYDYKNPKTSTLDIGLSNSDYTKLLIWFPILLAAVLCFILAFVDEWTLLGINSPMGAMSFGIFSTLMISLCGTFSIIFYFDMYLNSQLQTIFLAIYSICCIAGGLSRKLIISKGLVDNKYQRLFNTNEMDLIQTDPLRSLLFKLRNEGILPLIVLNCLFLFLILFFLINNNFIFNSTIMSIVFIDVLISIIYLIYFIKTEYNFEHRNTTTLN